MLLLSKEALSSRVLADPRIEIYDCGRTDIATGQIDRRVLATLEYLVEQGFRLTITSLQCGHGIMTASGNVSNHSSGNAVDIAVINGVPVLGHQGPGTLTDAAARTVLQLQGTMVPEELISLEELGRPSFALADHADHVHIGWQPLRRPLDKQFNALLKPDQWQRLINRLGEIDNPEVPIEPSRVLAARHDAKARGKATRRQDRQRRLAPLAHNRRPDPALRIRTVRLRRPLAVADGRYLARDGGDERACAGAGDARRRRRRPRRRRRRRARDAEAGAAPGRCR